MRASNRVSAAVGLALSLLAGSHAFAVNDLSQPPSSEVYWNQSSPGIVTPGAVGGEEDGDLFGGAAAGGDFNGDGYDDLAIGVPREDVQVIQMTEVDAGAITILYGGSSGLVGAGIPQGLFMVQGGAQFGYALGAGDIDGDGYDDLIAGAPFLDDGAASDAGAITVSYGSANGITGIATLIDQDSTEIPNNSEAGDRFGRQIAVGDINADGYADVAASATGESVGSSGANSGAVYVLYGGDDGLQGPNAPRPYQVFVESDAGSPFVSTADDQYGYAVLLHDLDADGCDDLIVGAPSNDLQDTAAGVVFVHPSDCAAIVATGTVHLFPTHFWGTLYGHNFYFGSSLAGGEIQEAGALRQLLIGVPGYNDGVASDYIGASAWYLPGHDFGDTIPIYQYLPEAPEPQDEFGRAVLIADLDGDGRRDDLVQGIAGEDNDSGALQVRQLLEDLNDRIIVFRGASPEPGDRLGEVLAHGNFDGRVGEELVVGIPHEDSNFVDSGRVLVLSWSPGDLIFADDFELITEAPSASPGPGSGH